MKNYITIDDPKNCCGCGACVNICAKNAIKMQEDKAGFIFPHVDKNLCVSCGRCISVCTFTEKGAGANGDPEVYAAVNKDREVLKNSSSGGVLSVLANAVLEKGGAVFGAAWADDMSVRHICVTDKTELCKLRGSKYVQSDIGDTYSQAKKLLREGKYVLFSGTPCQISGLKSFLGSDYENLLTADLVCHGVPSTKMLHDDLRSISEKNVTDLSNIKFRDKEYGWGVKGSYMCGTAKKKLNAGTSPYYFYFLKGEVYRESCYNCRYPSEGRQGDITLGDYWGIKQDVIAALGKIDPDLGISCVLVNTEKGRQWMKEAGDTMVIARSDRRSVEARNKQLTAASVPTPEHKTLLEGYKTDGYAAFKSGYKKHTKEHIIRTVKNMIPSKLKRKLNDLIS